MCYLLKEEDEFPYDVFMSEVPIFLLVQRTEGFCLREAADSETEFLLIHPPPWVKKYDNECCECSFTDLLNACLVALPVRCPKGGDWRVGLAGALRAKLVKKPRLCEIVVAVQELLDSERAAVIPGGRWNWALVKAGKQPSAIPVAAEERDPSDARSFPAGAVPGDASGKKRKRGGKSKRSKTKPTHLKLPFQ